VIALFPRWAKACGKTASPHLRVERTGRNSSKITRGPRGADSWPKRRALALASRRAPRSTVVFSPCGSESKKIQRLPRPRASKSPLFEASGGLGCAKISSRGLMKQKPAPCTWPGEVARALPRGMTGGRLDLERIPTPGGVPMRPSIKSMRVSCPSLTTLGAVTVRGSKIIETSPSKAAGRQHLDRRRSLSLNSMVTGQKMGMETRALDFRAGAPASRDQSILPRSGTVDVIRP